MIQPLMYLLATINEDTFQSEDHISLYSLNTYDYHIVVNSIKTLIDRTLNYENPDAITFSPLSSDEQIIVDVQQSSGDYTFGISDMTACALQIITRACAFWNVSYGLNINDMDSRNDEISENIYLHKLESNPRIIFPIVCRYLDNHRTKQAIEQGSNLQNSGIGRLTDLYHSIEKASMQQETDKSFNISSKIKMLSSLNFWRAILSQEYIKTWKQLPPKITVDTLTLIRDDLIKLDIHGFAPPDIIESKFMNTEVIRQISINVDSKATDFLKEIILSGGGRL